MGCFQVQQPNTLRKVLLNGGATNCSCRNFCYSLFDIFLLLIYDEYIGRIKGGQKMFDRITFDSQIMGGRACIRGMRIPVSVIVGQIAHGARVEEILSDYPDLEPEDIQQALEYAAWLTQEEVTTG